MSSGYVRTSIKDFLTANSPEVVVDFSAEYMNVKDILIKYSLADEDPFLGIEFIPSQELPQGILSNNKEGCYREFGTIFLHIVSAISLTHTDNIITRADALIDLFRGATINNEILVESVSPANFNSSATLNFDRGYEAATININFYRNNNL